MFVMCYIGRLDLVPRVHMDVIEVYNKMHLILIKVRFLSLKFRFMIGF